MAYHVFVAASTFCSFSDWHRRVVVQVDWHNRQSCPSHFSHQSIAHVLVKIVSSSVVNGGCISGCKPWKGMLHERQPQKATRVEDFDAEIAAFHDLNPIKYIALSSCCCLHQGSFRILLSKLRTSKSQPRCQPFPTSTSISVHVTSPKTTTSKLNDHGGPRQKVLLQPLDHQYDPEHGKRLEKRCRPVPSASRSTPHLPVRFKIPAPSLQESFFHCWHHIF